MISTELWHFGGLSLGTMVAAMIIFTIKAIELGRFSRACDALDLEVDRACAMVAGSPNGGRADERVGRRFRRTMELLPRDLEDPGRAPGDHSCSALTMWLLLLAFTHVLFGLWGALWVASKASSMGLDGGAIVAMAATPAGIGLAAAIPCVLGYAATKQAARRLSHRLAASSERARSLRVPA